MSNTITAQLSEEAQEALEFLQEKNIDVNQTINRIIMRAAQEEGWRISLVPGDASAQGKKAVEQSQSEVEPTPLELQPGDENTHLLAPVDPTPQVQPEVPVQPADPTPVPVEKPFKPGVVLAATMEDQSELPQASSIVKKTVVEPVAEIPTAPVKP